MPNSAPIYQRFSMAVSSSNNANSWGTTPILLLTRDACVRTSNEATLASPIDGTSNVVSIFMVVVFPAPFGPRNPKISPFFILRLELSTAVNLPNLMVNPVQSIAYSTAIQIQPCSHVKY